MPVLPDGSAPALVFSDTAASTSLVTATFTPPAGAILVVKIWSGDANQTHNGVTATGHTFTSRINTGTAQSTSRVSLWTAVATSAAITVTAAFGGTANTRAMLVEVYTGARLATSPALSSMASGSGAPSGTITTVLAGSVVAWASSDWSAKDGSARAYRSSAVETAYRFVSGGYTIYGAYQQAPTPGAQTFGLTAPTAQTFTYAAIELQDAALTRRRPARVSQAVNRAGNF